MKRLIFGETDSETVRLSAVTEEDLKKLVLVAISPLRPKEIYVLFSTRTTPNTTSWWWGRFLKVHHSPTIPSYLTAQEAILSLSSEFNIYVFDSRQEIREFVGFLNLILNS